MQKITNLIIIFTYYYSVLIGMMPLKIELKSGHARQSKFMTTYCLLANILLVASITQVNIIENILYAMRRENFFMHSIIYYTMSIVRIGGVCVTVLLNWKQRNEIIVVVRELLQLRQEIFARCQLPHGVKNQYERAIIWKCGLAAYTALSTWALSLDIQRKQLVLCDIVKTTHIALLESCISLVTGQFFFAVLNLNAFYRMLNTELERKLCELTKLNESGSEKRGVVNLMEIERGLLYDQLFQLTALHFRLHSVARRVCHMYEIHGAICLLIFYLNNIAFIFYFYATLKPASKLMGMSSMEAILFLSGTLSYYMDLCLFLSSMTDMRCLHSIAAQLLSYQLEDLQNVCTERGYELFYLQNASRKFEMPLMGLFDFSKAIAFSVFSSTVSHAIILIQYDYENF